MCIHTVGGLAFLYYKTQTFSTEDDEAVAQADAWLGWNMRSDEKTVSG